MLSGLATVTALTVTAAVPAARPIMIPLQVLATAARSAAVTCRVPAAPPTPMVVAALAGLRVRFVEFNLTEPAPPEKVRVFAVIVVVPRGNTVPTAPTEKPPVPAMTVSVLPRAFPSIEVAETLSPLVAVPLVRLTFPVSVTGALRAIGPGTALVFIVTAPRLTAAVVMDTPPAVFVVTLPDTVVVPVPALWVTEFAATVEENVTLAALLMVSKLSRVAPTAPVKVIFPPPAVNVRL
jgi:hypothetical protein